MLCSSERSDFIYNLLARSLLTARGLSQLQNSFPHNEYMLGVRQWRHGAFSDFAFPSDTDFAADDQGAFSCIIHERLLCLFIVYETMFTIGESRTISHANDTQAQELAPNTRPGRFSTEIPLERKRQLKIQREQRTEFRKGYCEIRMSSHILKGYCCCCC